MQAKNHARTTRRITTLVIASLVLGGCLSSEENVEDFSGGNSVNTPTNSAPVISGNPATTVNVGGFYSFVPTASDSDGDALTFSIENEPTWGSFNSGSGEVSGQPTLGDVGVYQDIRISVTDGADSASLEPSLSINVCPPGDEANCCELTPTAYSDEHGPLGNGTVIGDLLTSADTFHSIGFVWDIDGDADHDGSVSVRYRKAGACNFSPALPLIRNDYQWFWTDNYPPTQDTTNNFAGSLMFLTPGTTYEVVLELSDPDGGRAIRVHNLTTRAIPRKPTAGRTLYVVPGSGGGDGSDGNPFQGIDAANAAALPGDRMLLRNGTYTTGTLSTSGAEDNHIVYEPDTGHSPVIDTIGIAANHIWIDNLTFTWNDPNPGTDIEDQHWLDTTGIYITASSNNPDDVVITNNTFTGFMSGIQAPYALSRWVVMDNTIVGWRPVGRPPPTNGSTGRGIAIGGEHWAGGPGCVVAYNSITQVVDGIGISENCDVYGNQVYDIAGNACSSDSSWGNVRIWGNRFMYTVGAPITMQPQKAGPWYWLYNQMGDNVNGVFKFRTQDRAVMINNTFLDTNEARGHVFMKFFMRNNLFIVPEGTRANWNTSGGSPPVYNLPQFTADWNTDIDYDGFQPGSDGNFFSWFGNSVSYDSISEWSTDVGGAEANAIEVDAELIFDDYTLDPFNSLELASGTNAAVDAGQVVPNLADFYLGSAPDLGAHQRGADPLPYGPRGSGTPLDEQENYWAKH